MQIFEFDSDMTQPRLVPIAAGQDAEQFQGIVGSLASVSQASQDDPIILSGAPEEEDATFREVITDRDVITEGVTSRRSR